jgi:heme A synthase
VETLIEYTHRISSGAALLLVLLLAIWAWRISPPRPALRRTTGLSVIFILTEALIGAFLVVFELAGENDALIRGLVSSLHLANTFLLLAVLALSAWWATIGAPSGPLRAGRIRILGGVGLLVVILMGMSGAIAALGDSLFPVRELGEGLRQDLAPGSHPFLRMRLLHPVLAISAALVWGVALREIIKRDTRTTVRALTSSVYAIFGLQLLAGLVNVALLAPVWLQLTHLLLADTLWVLLVLTLSAHLALDRLDRPSHARQTVSSS